MLNLEKCKKILEEKGNKYTEQEIKKLRDLLYKIGYLDYEMYYCKKNTNDEKCNLIHESIHR